MPSNSTRVLGSIGTLCVGAALVGTWAFIDWGFVNGTITVYSAQCTVPVENGKCAGSLMTATPTTYQVRPDQQIVLYWIEGFPKRKALEVCGRGQDELELPLR